MFSNTKVDINFLKIAIMQPYFLPYMGYWQLIEAVDKFIVYDDVNYINRGWINRNRMLIQGKSHWFTIPLIKASQNRLINEIFIIQEVPWQKNMLNSIEHAYKKAPYFDEVHSLMVTILSQEVRLCSCFIYLTLKLVCEYLNIKAKFVLSSTTYQNQHLHGQDRIMDICLQEEAATYVNPIGGMDLYKRELFSDENIGLKFIRTNPLVYKQFGSEFVFGLSILDVLMFNSQKNIQVALERYTLE